MKEIETSLKLCVHRLISLKIKKKSNSLFNLQDLERSRYKKLFFNVYADA